MHAIDKQNLISAICPPLDSILSEQMIDEYISMHRRYIVRDWEPATLDGGQFCEATARLLYHQDSGILNLKKDVDECLMYVAEDKGKNIHKFPKPRNSSKHIGRVVRTIYKFRSDRGAVHIDPDYSANQLDSKMVLENCGWILSEFLRIFWTKDRSVVAETIKQIVKYNIPIVGVYDNIPIIQRTDCSAEEEILILLFYAGEEGYSRKMLGQAVKKSPSQISRALPSLTSPKRRLVVKVKGTHYRLTDLGNQHVLEELINKFEIP